MTPPLGAWGLTGTPVPLSGGHRNTVLRVGQHVLKSTRRSEAALAWLLPIARHAKTCGLDMPTPLRSRRGAFVVDGWTCEPFCAGAPTAPKIIADRVARLHRATINLPQRDGFECARSLLTKESGGDIDLQAMPAGLVAQIRTAWQAVADDTTAVHGDLNPANILTDGKGVTTLIDWDEARRDHPLFDTVTWTEEPSIETRRATLAWEIACSWQTEPSHARDLVPALLLAMTSGQA